MADRIPIPPLPFREFKDGESFKAHMEERRKLEARADEMIQPWQAALTWGDKACYEFHYADGTPVTIYFEIKRSKYKEDHWREGEIFPRRVSGWGYSTYCPEGEPGTTHRAVFERKLTEAEWTDAMQRIKDTTAVFQKMSGQ